MAENYSLCPALVLSHTHITATTGYSLNDPFDEYTPSVTAKHMLLLIT